MSEELTADQRAWMLKEAERHMRDYAARGVSNNAATVLLAEYDRMRTELDQRVAWELYREDCHREDDECYFHSASQSEDFLAREHPPTSGPNVDTWELLTAEANRWIETGTGLVPRDRPLVLEPPTFPDPASHA